MSCHNFKELKKHIGHKIVCVYCYDALVETKEGTIYCSNEMCLNGDYYNKETFEIDEDEIPDFIIGQEVLYDVYPHGTNINGVIVKDGIQTTGKYKKEFEQNGMSTFISFEDAGNIRVVDKKIGEVKKE